MKSDTQRRTQFSLINRRLVSIALTVLVILAMSGEAAPTRDGAHVAPPVAVQHAIPDYPRLRDEAAMVLVGAALIALAAAVRRAA